MTGSICTERLLKAAQRLLAGGAPQKITPLLPLPLTVCCQAKEPLSSPLCGTDRNFTRGHPKQRVLRQARHPVYANPRHLLEILTYSYRDAVCALLLPQGNLHSLHAPESKQAWNAEIYQNHISGSTLPCRRSGTSGQGQKGYLVASGVI